MCTISNDLPHRLKVRDGRFVKRRVCKRRLITASATIMCHDRLSGFVQNSKNRLSTLSVSCEMATVPFFLSEMARRVFNKAICVKAALLGALL